MKSIKFTIPTYNRYNKQDTLSYLKSVGVPKEDIYLAVHDEVQLSFYERYSNDVADIIVTNAKNVSQNRNPLLSLFAKGTHLLQLDDDIKHLSYLGRDREGKEKLFPIADPTKFYGFLEHAFAKTILSKTIMWGIYPVHNAYFMSNKIKSPSLIEGTLIGLITDDLRFNPKFELKGDYELSCRVIKKYGTTLRFNNVAANAPHYSKGGCYDFWKNNMKLCDMLMELHSDILRLNPKREGEVLINI